MRAGHVDYGRSRIIVWDVETNEDDVRYKYVEVSKDATDNDIRSELQKRGYDTGDMDRIMETINNIAIED